MAESKTKFSIADRILLANQYLILEKLVPEEAESYREKRTIVENGYESHRLPDFHNPGRKLVDDL